MRSFLLFGAVLPAAMAFGGKKHLARAPAPTPAPDADLVARLLPRQGGNVQTCGWVSGQANDAVTCSPDYSCAHNNYLTAFGCCSGNLATCTLQSICFDSTFAVSIEATANAFTQLCLNSASPYCNTYMLANGYSGFGCGTAEQLIEVATSIAGAQAGAITSGFVPSPTSAAGGTAAATSAGITAQQSTVPAPTSTGAGSQNSTSNQGGGSDQATTHSSTSLSTGAIVGIAICGGVVILGVLALIAYCVKKRNANRPVSASVVPGGYGPVPQQGGVIPPGQPPMSPTTTFVPSQVGSGMQQPGPGQPMTQQNMDAYMAAQAGEWDFAKRPVVQHQTAGTEEDGIKPTEISPEEAVDEPKPNHEQPQQMYDGRTEVMSAVAPTAVAPTTISHNVQAV